jgi:hypothetical protein
MRKKSKKPVTTATSRRTKKKSASAQGKEYAYDISFEILLRLARVAITGRDVNAILLEMVKRYSGELWAVPEFQVAMGALTRPANASLTLGL